MIWTPFKRAAITVAIVLLLDLWFAEAQVRESDLPAGNNDTTLVIVGHTRHVYTTNVRSTPTKGEIKK